MRLRVRSAAVAFGRPVPASASRPSHTLGSSEFESPLWSTGAAKSAPRQRLDGGRKSRLLHVAARPRGAASVHCGQHYPLRPETPDARALSHLSTQTLHGRCVAAVSRHNHRAAARRSARAAVSRARLSPAAQAKTNSMPQGLTRTTLVTVPALVPRCSRRSRLSSVASPRSRPHGGATGGASDTPLRAVRLHILRLSRRG